MTSYKACFDARYILKQDIFRKSIYPTQAPISLIASSYWHFSSTKIPFRNTKFSFKLFKLLLRKDWPIPAHTIPPYPKAPAQAYRTPHQSFQASLQTHVVPLSQSQHFAHHLLRTTSIHHVKAIFPQKLVHRSSRQAFDTITTILSCDDH